MPAMESGTNGGAPAAAPGHEQAAAIEGLRVAVGRLRRGAAAVKAEKNRQLRAEIAGLQPMASRQTV